MTLAEPTKKPDLICINTYEHDNAEVEEYPLDLYDPAGIGRLCYWNFEYHPTSGEWQTRFNTDKTQWKRRPLNKVEKRESSIFGVSYEVTTRGESKVEALKIANEKIMQVIAKEK